MPRLSQPLAWVFFPILQFGRMSGSQLTEEYSIEGLRAGSERDFAALVRKHQDMVYNTCLGFVPNQHDAEDLCQEVFVRAFRKISTFQGESSIKTWLYRITVNECLALIRYRRRKKRAGFFRALLRSEWGQEMPSPLDHPGIALENKERADVLYAKIHGLSDKQRTAFTLHKVDGLSHREVAEIMNLSVSSVESLVHRAKRKLEDELRDFYEKKII